MFCDIHNHILPAVDDGAQSLDDSLRMFDQALHAGITTLCATPHIRSYQSETITQEKHIAVGEMLRNELAKRDITLDLHVGCEMYYTSEFQDLAKNTVFHYQQRNGFVLVELPPAEAPAWFADICFSLMMNGTKILLAHPERNIALMRNPLVLAKYLRTGICTQVTAGSIVGKYGKEIQEFALRIVRSGAATVIACDAHDTFRRPFSDIAPCYDEIATTLGTIIADRLCSENPRAILEGGQPYQQIFDDEAEQALLKKARKKRFLFF